MFILVLPSVGAPELVFWTIKEQNELDEVNLPLFNESFLRPELVEA
jgi:hypothetical protein